MDNFETISGVLEVLQVIPEDVASRFMVFSWLQQPNPSLNDETPLELLYRGELTKVLHVAKAVAERWSH